MSIILDLLYPKACYGCGRLGQYLCSVCSHRYLVLNSIRPCQHPILEGQLSLFHFDGPLRSMILDLKYSFTSDIVSTLSDIAAKAIKKHYPNFLKYLQENQFSILPVPLHYQRQNWRGFNQSQLLAVKLSQSLSLPLISEIPIRQNDSSPQVSQPSKQARSSSVHTFVSSATYGNLLIFDDVITTGQTINSLLNSLNIKGKVWALSLAGS